MATTAVPDATLTGDHLTPCGPANPCMPERVDAPGADFEASCAEVRRADLGWALGVVFRSYQKMAILAVDDLPGGPRGYQVLAAATHDAPGTQLALAQLLGVDRTVMTYLLDDLERAGLIVRQPDPADRRARRVVATEAGRARLDTLEQHLQQAEEHVLGTLDPAERDLFRSLIGRLANSYDLADPANNPCSVAEDVIKSPNPPMRRRRT